MTTPDTNGRPIEAVLVEYAQVIAEQPDVDSIVARLGQYCTELLPLHGVGVLLIDADGELEVATANTEAGKIVENLEAELREGPCTDCLRLGEQVAVPDLERAAASYPRFAPRALDAGVAAIHALPLASRGTQAGAVDLISLEPQVLTSADLGRAQLLTDVTMAYLSNSRLLAASTRLAGQLQRALDSRVVVEQAKGVLAERHGIGVSEAFERIRRRARSTGTKVRDVAEGVLAGDLDP